MQVDYCVNGHHVFSFGVSANVVPVTVDLSAEEVHFEYALDNWDNHLERMVQVRVCVCVCVCVSVCVCQAALLSIQTGDSPVSGSQIRT